MIRDDNWIELFWVFIGIPALIIGVVLLWPYRNWLIVGGVIIAGIWYGLLQKRVGRSVDDG